jgi:cobalt-zinc-cadmium efflux system outer membrane protein
MRGVATPQDVAERVAHASGYPVRVDSAEPAIPPDVSLADGLSEDEAVAIALWNSPAFQERLADLGVARADVAQAGLLRNPVLTLLLPWGPKQLEATAKWPIDAIWQRPRRLAAARVAADAVATRLVADGLEIVAGTRLAFAELVAAEARVALAQETVGLLAKISELAASRFAAGDISQLEADIAAAEAAGAAQDVARAAVNIATARNRLRELLAAGDRAPLDTLRPVAEDPAGPSCGDAAELEREALAARPDLRAAELEIEAAGLRLGWERSRIFSLVAILDANANGSEGFELGPGVETDFGLFDRNQAGVMRAAADLDRGKARYRAARLRIAREIGDAYARFAASRDALVAWRDDISPRLARQAEQTRRAYEAGELSYLNVVDALRRLNAGRTRELEAMIDQQRALVELERTVGRRCAL